MCTLILLSRPGHDWPLLVAANRDERVGRPCKPPARHWPDRPDVTAGLDCLAQGTWLGLNDYGVVAGVLNRQNTLGPSEDHRSRGELPLEALDHAEAIEAARALAHIEPSSYRPFNLVVADRRQAFWLCLREEGGVEVKEIPPGLSMITALDLNDTHSSRVRTYLPQFKAAPAPDPETGDFSSWQALLKSQLHGAESGPEGAMNVVTGNGFGTLSSSLIALPSVEQVGVKPVWLFSPGNPTEFPYDPVVI